MQPTQPAVVFGSPVSVGHVRPLMPLARRLCERGYAVIWAISGDDNEPASRWRAPIEALGARFVDLDATAPFRRESTEAFASVHIFRRLVGRANDVSAGAAAAIEAALDGRRVVCGVYDFFAVWAYVAMRRLHIDRICTIVSAFPGILDTLPPDRYLDDPLYMAELAQLRDAGIGAFADPPRAGIIPCDPALQIGCFTSPRLCPNVPAGIHLFGVSQESVSHADADAPEAHRALARTLRAAQDRGARVVLLSMGTMVTRMFMRMGETHVAFLRRMYGTLARSALDAGAVVVASTCDATPADLGVDAATLGAGAADRVFAMPFVPQPFLFAQRLVDVMLMHGGANTFHEAVVSGIPLLVSPGFGDQLSVARAATQLGVGVCLEAIMYPDLADAVPIARAATDVLPAMLAEGASPWKTAATRLAEQVKQENALDAAVALLRL